jgi:peptidoglycan/LPS O-acetylase OafA/YrhL
MQTLYSIPLFLIGLGFVVYGFVKTIQVWPRNFFISEKARTRRSTKSGIAGAVLIFGVFLLMLVFVGEEVTFFQLIKTLCFFGASSILIGIVGGISTYGQLRLVTKLKDDIGTIRDK